MVLTTPIERARGGIRSAWSDVGKAGTKLRHEVVDRVRSRAPKRPEISAPKGAVIAAGGAAVAVIGGLYVLARRTLGGREERPQPAPEQRASGPEPLPAGNGRPSESEAAKAAAK